MKFCQNCGFEMPETAKFCGKCKTAFTAPAQSDAPQATPPPTQQAAQQPAPSIPVAYQPQPENMNNKTPVNKKNKKVLIIAVVVGLLVLGGIIFSILYSTSCNGYECLRRPNGGGRRCIIHTCRLSNCTESAMVGTYCWNHTCWESGCNAETVDGGRNCFRHADNINNQGATTDTGTTANSTIPAENVENNLIGKWVGQATVADEFGRYGEFKLEFSNDGTGHYYAIYSGYEGNYEIVWSLSDVDMVEYRSVSGVNSFTWRIINLNSNELVLGISEIEVHFKKDF